MATVTPGKNAPGRGKSLRGRIVFRTCRGQLIAQKWPRPRGRPKTTEHKQQVAWFGQAQKLAKRVDAKTQARLLQATQNSPLMPRDLATSLMAGRTFAISIGPHQTIRSKRAMADVSEVLDTISETPGSTLVRGEKFWQGQTPQIAAAQWLIPDPVGIYQSVQSSSPFAWRGAIVNPLLPVGVQAIATTINLQQSGTYQAAAVRLDNTGTIKEVHLSPTQQAPLAGLHMLAFKLTVGLTPGNRWSLMVGRTDAGATYPLPSVFLNSGRLPIPSSEHGWTRLATTTPTIGQQPDSGSTGLAAVWPLAGY